MVWTTLSTPIKLDIDWQFTEPIEGQYFRFKHESSPVNAIYEIAQVELNDDGSYTLFDSQVLTVERGFVDTIKLSKPGIFAQRRLAIRRIPARPTFEQEIRRLLLPGYLQPSDFPPSAAPRNRWQVQIESSDYIEPSALVDLSPIQTKLNEISQKIDNLQTSGGSTTPTNSTAKTLTYASDGDANGVCYWIGTNYGVEGWTNPHVSGRLICSLSSSFDGNDPPGNLVDRQNNQRPATQNAPNSWMMLDLGANKLICKYYSLKGRDAAADHLRSWRLQASNDNNSWLDLDTQTNNATINQNTWFSTGVNSTTAYKYFRVLQTAANNGGTNIMSLGEWEFYGEFIK